MQVDFAHSTRAPGHPLPIGEQGESSHPHLRSGFRVLSLLSFSPPSGALPIFSPTAPSLASSQFPQL